MPLLRVPRIGGTAPLGAAEGAHRRRASKRWRCPAPSRDLVATSDVASREEGDSRAIGWGTLGTS
jgi:hypothetical protein